jgi:nucleotide-binding universal stress UspA family protein
LKVLIGHDGSASAGDALALAAALPWPAFTEITVVRVASSSSTASAASAEVRALASALEGANRTVTAEVRVGRPANAIASAAEESAADLLILGSRGFSPIRSLLLGSVSGELVEHAPCSVLIARGTGHDLILVGTDGSRDATAMPRTMCAWELFRGTHALVLGVAPVDAGDDAPKRHELALATRRLAARLDTCGLQARDRVGSGDPADVLIQAAHDEGADLVAVGHRGRSAVSLLLLGSVARKVVQHAPCSVLVVRSPTT